MNFESKIKEMEKIASKAQVAVTALAEQISELKTIGEDDWDWVSVKKASEYSGVSPCLIYRKVANNELESRRFETKILVRKSDMEKINDKK